MLLERYPRSRRRWIVGCIAVSIAVMVMLLTPPSGVVSMISLVTFVATVFRTLRGEMNDPGNKFTFTV